ncbi:MAG: hypothetical protein A2Y21_11355 [Clostridiales bacterium GWC2_40_7]|nr:MAG: hypothetical protein A2Y21_11355 [Clostridiales bacterium GWC2_40_7]
MKMRIFNSYFSKSLILFSLCVLFAAISLMLFSIPVSAATTYYVATTGSDWNDGSINSPWRDINYAVNHVSAGDTINVRAGTYWERVVFGVSGSAGNIITLQPYPNESVMISGSGVSLSGEMGLIDIADKSYITVTGFELCYYAEDSNAANRPDGIYIHGACSNISISNCNIHDIAHNNVTSSNYAGAHGILVCGSSSTAMSNITFNGNNVHNNTNGWCENVTFVGNINGFTISNNTVHDNTNIGIDAAGHYTWANSDQSVNYARNGTISGNTVYKCTTLHNPATNNSYSCAGIYSDGSSNVTIEKNTVYSCDYGIASGAENHGYNSGSIIIRNNFVYFCVASGITLGGYDPANNGGAASNYVLNNTIFGNNTSIDPTNSQTILGGAVSEGDFRMMSNCVDNVISNNIVYPRSDKNVFVHKYEKVNDTCTGNSIDYNLYYTEGANTYFYWNNDSSPYTTFTSWKTGTGFDTNSIYGSDPLLVNESTPDLHIQASSPARDSGTNNGNIGSTDIDGDVRTCNGTVDIGAHETTMVIDGSATDWNNTTAVATASGQAATSLKVFSDNEYLYFCIQGSGLGTNYDLFIDADNNSDTGYVEGTWTSTGLDYLVENGTLYESTSRSWGWNSLGTTNVSTSKNSSVCEIRIARSALSNLASTIKVGYKDIDGSWNLVCRLPSTGALPSYTLN